MMGVRCLCIPAKISIFWQFFFFEKILLKIKFVIIFSHSFICHLKSKQHLLYDMKLNVTTAQCPVFLLILDLHFLISTKRLTLHSYIMPGDSSGIRI